MFVYNILLLEIEKYIKIVMAQIVDNKSYIVSEWKKAKLFPKRLYE